MGAPITREDKSYDQSFTHGTLSAYLRHECSCAVCRSFWVSSQRQREQHRVLRRAECVEVLKPHITDPEALAEAVGVPVGRIHRILRGGRWQGSFSQLRAMAQELGVDLPQAHIETWSRRPGGI